MPQQKDKRPRNSSSSSESWPGSLNSRAERSRHAAKMRRDKEAVEITALSKLLPYPDEVIDRLDKGSIIRLTTSYLRMKKFSKEGNVPCGELNQKAITDGDNPTCASRDMNDGALMLQALNGFVIFVSRKGKIYYISENVGKHLGIHQYELTGNSIMEFIHPEDQKELAKQFVVQVPGQQTFRGYGMENAGDAPTSMSFNCFDDKGSDDQPSLPITDFIQERQFFLRMRSVMSRRGSGGKGKVVGFRVMNFCGRLKLVCSSNSSKGYTVEGLICLCRPIRPQPILEVRMDGNMFMSRHSLDMSFTFCDPRIITLIGYEPRELIGKTVYQFHNPLDARKVSDCHSNLIVKGTSATKYYRFMGKNCSWVWMQTKATIIYNTNNVAQYIVCMNYVIGQDVGERELMMEQMAKTKAAGEAWDSLADSSECRDSINSPGSDGGRFTPNISSGSSVTSGIGSSCSDIEDQSSANTVKEEGGQFDASLIPQPVRNHETIMKPPPAKQEISFAALLKMDNLKSMYGATEKMDTSEPSEGGKQQESPPAAAVTVSPELTTFNCNPSVQGPFDNPLLQDSTNIQSFQRATPNQNVVSSTSSEVMFPLQVFSPISEVGSDSASSNAGSSVHSESLAPLPETKDEQMIGVGDDDSLFKDLIELTKNDSMVDPLANPDCPDIPRMSFSVNSPSNLSQLLNRQGSASVSLGGVSSPGSQDLPDESVDGEDDDDEVFNGRPESGEDASSSILAGLLAKPPLNPPPSNDAVTSTSGDSPQPRNVMNIAMASRSIGQLPDDIANFSLEFCMDQSSYDEIPSLGDEFYLCDSMDKTMSNSGCATITEINEVDNSDIQGVAAADIDTPIAPMTNSTQPCQLQQYPLCNDGADDAPTEHLNVTKGISQLEIDDRSTVGSQEQEASSGSSTPILQALLLSRRNNKMTARGECPPPLNLNTVDDLLGPITPSTKAAVEAVDSLIQDFDRVPASDGAVHPVVNSNNNMEDYALIQQLTEQRQLMVEEHRRQQQILMEKQIKQQKLLEQQQQELLQNQHQSTRQHALLCRQMQQQQQVHLSQQSSMPANVQMNTIGVHHENGSLQGYCPPDYDLTTEFPVAQQTGSISASHDHGQNHHQMQQYSASPPVIMDPFRTQQLQQQQQQQQQQQHASPPVMVDQSSMGTPSTMQHYNTQHHVLHHQQPAPVYPSQLQPSYCRPEQNMRVFPIQVSNGNALLIQPPQWGNTEPYIAPHPGSIKGRSRTMEQADTNFGLADSHMLQQ